MSALKGKSVHNSLYLGLVSAGILISSPSFAQNNVFGVSIASQRDPHDFNKSVSTVTGVSYSHVFDNKLILDASMTYFDVSNSNTWHLNSQIGLGYRYEFSDVLSVVGIASIGSRAQNTSTDFPYYSLHGAVDWKIMPAVTWSVVTFRYRNAFNTDYEFETPALGSALGFRIDNNNSISLNYLREWDEGKVADNLFGLGYQYHF